MKKVLSVCFMLCSCMLMLLGLWTTSKVSAASSSNFEYSVDSEGNATITKYTGQIDTLCTVPMALDGHPVVTIGEYAFASAGTLQSITIPSSVTKLEGGAFMSITTLQNVIIQGTNLVSIGDSAFWGCTSLQTVAIPESVKSIGAYAFFSCNKMTTLTIPSTVQEIGAQAFGNTKIVMDAPNGSTAQKYAKDTGMTYYISASSVILNATSKQLEASKTFQLSAVLNEGTLSSQAILRSTATTWVSSDTSVAVVDSTGLVTAVANGKAKITVSTLDGNCSDTCEIIVSTPMTSVSLSQTTSTLNVGNTLQLTPMFNPAQASNKTVTWATTNPEVATVKDGLVTAVSSGTTTITVTTEDGNFKATCVVTVVYGVTSVSLSPNIAAVEVGKTLKLTSVFYPVTATNKKVTWTSSNQVVATVDDTGLVTGKENGTAIITVLTTDGNYTATALVTVSTPITTFALNTKELKLNVGKSAQLNTVVTPTTATPVGILWSSSDTKVVTVNANGLVQAVANGTATITAATYDGKFSVTCPVSVTTSVSSVSLGMRTAGVEQGKTLKLTPTFYPSTVSNKSVSWTSSNTAVATVDMDGNVTALSDGTAIITVQTSDGNQRDNVTITVATRVKEIQLDKTSYTLIPTGRIQLQATILPEKATNKKVLWKSSKTSVATVSSDGIVTGVANGTTQITVTTEDGKLVKVCKITVKTPVTSVKLNVKSKTLKKAQTYTLKATVKPNTASNASVQWKSSNKKVATVTSKGVVKAVGKGTATITVTTKDGGKKDTCKITVKEVSKKTK